MKIAFWVMFCANVLSRSRALDCEDSACLNAICPLINVVVPGYRLSSFKCPYDNYCMSVNLAGGETFSFKTALISLNMLNCSSLLHL